MPLILLIAGVVAVGGLLYLNEKKAATVAAKTAIATAPTATNAAPSVIVAPPAVADTTGSAATVQTATIEATAVETATSAIPVVGGALAKVESIFLGAHVARLNDAIAENQLIPQVVEAFDADLTEICQYYNEGEASAAQCYAALIAMDKTIYATMRNNAQAKPGIAWNTNPAYSASTAALVGSTAINPAYGAPCDKTCTVSCCVYYNDLRPAIFGRNVIGPGNTSKAAYATYQNPAGSGLIMGALQAIALADAGHGPQTVHVIEVSPPDDPAYGTYSRAAYNLTFTKPASLLAAVNVSIG